MLQTDSVITVHGTTVEICESLCLRDIPSIISSYLNPRQLIHGVKNAETNLRVGNVFAIQGLARCRGDLAPNQGIPRTSLSKMCEVPRHQMQVVRKFRKSDAPFFLLFFFLSFNTDLWNS